MLGLPACFCTGGSAQNGDDEYKSINGICAVRTGIKHIRASALTSAARYVTYRAPAGFSCVVSSSVSLLFPHVATLKMGHFNFFWPLNRALPPPTTTTKKIRWALSLITRNTLEVENKHGLTESKQAIRISKAISARPSLPYPRLSVCLSGVLLRVQGWVLMREGLAESLGADEADGTEKGNGVARTQLIWPRLFFLFFLV